MRTSAWIAGLLLNHGVLCSLVSAFQGCDTGYEPVWHERILGGLQGEMKKLPLFVILVLRVTGQRYFCLFLRCFRSVFVLEL